MKLLIINPLKQREYIVTIRKRSELKCIDDANKMIINNFPDDNVEPDTRHLEYGYIIPGQGLRGKEWLTTSCDVTEMLKIHKGAEVIVWCYRSTRRSRS